MLLSLIRMIQAFRDYQRNVSELSQLSDPQLADIGLDRSDIPRAAAGSYNGWFVSSRLTNGYARLAAGVVVSGAFHSGPKSATCLAMTAAKSSPKAVHIVGA